jgi:hypothetical protein
MGGTHRPCLTHGSILQKPVNTLGLEEIAAF